MIFKNISILMTGTVISQLIPIAMSPILTRIYTPAELGVVAVFTSLASFFAIFANLRLDVGIMSAKNKKEKLILRNLSVIVTALITLLVCFLLIVFADLFKAMFKGINYNLILIFIPLFVMLFGILQLLTYMANSKGYYKVISKSKIDKNLSMVIIQIILGFSKTGVLGLIIGMVASFIFPLVRLRKETVRGNFRMKFTKLEYQDTLKKYKKFPLISTATAAMNKFATESPVLIMNRFVDQSSVGFFDLARRTILQPLSFISASISQVYLKQITEEQDYRKNIKLTIVILAGLTLVSIFVATIIILWGESIFAIVFGEEWRVVGEYSKILVFPFLIRFIVSPLSVVFLKPENITLGGVWQFMYLVTSLTVTLIFLPAGFMTYIKAFAITEICIYLIYLAMILFALRRDGKRSQALWNS
ncbi:lipopolysaccharide biosynthesis protein [Ureibacillus sp. GCM10028918]|uniref:lipopolysaccharide biosynthesis protein n=1 Tax=Ureibacillus sp. GCM10028918 TaxID=3273429 RepID=UPI0036F2E40F